MPMVIGYMFFQSLRLMKAAGMPNRIMYLTLLTNFCCFRPNLRLFFSRHTSHCYRINLLMRLPVPIIENREVRSTSGRFACKELHALYSARLCRLARPSNRLVASFIEELLYRDVLRKAFSLVQTLELVRFYKA